MKIKPLYIYGILIGAALVVLLFFTTRDNGSKDIVNEQMPQDDVHRQFKNDQPPDRSNVSPQFYQELEELRKEVEKNPDDTTKLKEYADYLTAAHQFDSAVPLYEQVLSKNPRRTDIYFALTFIYFNKKDFNKAEEVTNKVLSYDKNNLQAQYNLGAIAATMGNNEKAKEIWTKLYEQHPDTREANLAKDGLAKLK